MSDKITNQPAGATPLDDVSGLLADEVTTRGELDELESVNILSATEWVRRGRGVSDVFTVPFYRELHRRMLNGVWSWAGKTRTTDTTNIGVPGTHIVREMGLLAMHANQRWVMAGETVEFYAWYHHRAVWVHPFLNGNGRWARLLCDAVRVRKARAAPLTWATADLGDDGAERRAYIAHLKAADAGDIEPLCAYIKERNPDL